MKHECTGIKLFPIDEDLIKEADGMLTKTLVPFFGTLKVHQVVYSSRHTVLDFRSLSCFRKCTHFHLSSKNKEKILNKKDPEFNKPNKRCKVIGTKRPTYEVGDWVMVDYDNTLYPGEIISMEGESFQINVMVSTGNNRYKWPVKKDIHMYTLMDIKYKLPHPTPCSRKARQFRFHI